MAFGIVYGTFKVKNGTWECILVVPVYHACSRWTGVARSEVRKHKIIEGICIETEIIRNDVYPVHYL